MGDVMRIRVQKIFNNNVILASSVESGQEIVLVGKGIGFGKKTNLIYALPLTSIESSFVAFDETTKNQYMQLINQLDSGVMGISEEIIFMAEEALGPLNPHIHIALTDHISFAIERLRSGHEISNPFLNEVKILYTEEYKLGIEAVKRISNKLGVSMPESETAFIAMHLHSARQNKKVCQTVKYASVLNGLVKMVSKELKMKFEPTDISYIRLVSHFKFALDRIDKGKKTNNPMLDKIKEEFSESYRLATKLAGYIEKKMNINVSSNECGYFALHIQRLKEN